MNNSNLIKRKRTFAFQCDDIFQDAETEIPWYLNCICGFNGEPKVVGRKTKRYHFETYRLSGYGGQVWELYCPHCNKLVDGLFHIEKWSQRFIDCCKIYDNGNKISLSIGVTQYFRRSVWEDKVTGRKQYFVRFTLNIDTGRTYLVFQGKIRDITFSFKKLKSFLTDDFNIGLLRKSSRKLIADWLSLCLKKRGVKYANLPDLYKDDLTQIHIASIFIILRYPVLQHMPFSRWAWMPPQYRKPLEKAKGVADIWAILTGHSGRKLRSITSDLGRFAKLIVWAPHFKKQDNLIRLFEYFRFSADLWNPASDYVFCAGKMEEFHGGMEILKKLYQDETILTRKLLAFKPRLVINDQEYNDLDSLMFH